VSPDFATTGRDREGAVGARTIEDFRSLTVAARQDQDGEVFLLDMGQPIRVLDMARRFIRSNGLEPDVDVQVQITGIRPGEKLYEELAYGSEDMSPTPHPSVRRWRTPPPDPARMRRVLARFDALRGQAQGVPGSHLWQHATRQDILAALHEAVPEMVSPAVAALKNAG